MCTWENKLLADGTRLVLLDNASVQDAFLASHEAQSAKYNATLDEEGVREGIAPAPPPLKLTDEEVIGLRLVSRAERLATSKRRSSRGQRDRVD